MVVFEFEIGGTFISFKLDDWFGIDDIFFVSREVFIC